MTDRSDAFATLLTPPGAGAIAVIRLSGPDASAILQPVFRARSGAPSLPPALGRARYGVLVDGDEVIDDAIVTAFPSGGTTAMDVCCHGGVRVVERVLQLLERRGASIGEESARALRVWPVNTRIDRDVVSALYQAQTERAVRFLLWQQRRLAEMIESAARACREEIDLASRLLADLVRPYAAARALTHGATVAIVGPPNSGKSTLFNRLVGREAAVVSPAAGTTRDWVDATIEIGGVPIHLVDTAGDRPVDDPLETLAIRRGLSVASEADILLHVVDGSLPCGSPGPYPPILRGGQGDRAEAAKPVSFLVLNKADAGLRWEPVAGDRPIPGPTARVSARTGMGIRDLCTGLLRVLEMDRLNDETLSVFLPSHVDRVQTALSELKTGASGAAEILEKGLIR